MRGFRTDEPSTSWETGLIVGNGTVGCVVCGEPDEETLVLSRAGLFAPSSRPLPPPPLARSLARVRKMLEEGAYESASSHAADIGRQAGIDRLIWTDPLVPAAQIEIRQDPANAGQRADATDFYREVDFASGLARWGWTQSGARIRRELFASRPAGLIVARLSARPGPVDATLHLGMRESPGPPPDSGLSPIDLLVAEHVLRVEEASGRDGSKTALCRLDVTFRTTWPGSLTGYCVVTRITAPGGEVRMEGSHVRVTGAKSILVTAGVALFVDGQRSGTDALIADVRDMPLDFETERDRHRAVHAELMSRSRLELDGPGMLNGLQFDAARYALVSSIGRLPPTLTGIWSGSWRPAWSADYTANGNLQTALEGLLPAGLSELMLPYFDYLEAHLHEFRTNARELYGAGGIYVPSRMSSHGLMNHYNETYCHLFWTGGAAWAAHFYYDYFRVTGDTEFLRSRAIPFMREAVRFLEQFIVDGHDGCLHFIPSYSPENSPSNLSGDVQACIDAAMDVDLTRELLQNLLEAYRRLELTTADTARWEQMLERLPRARINDEGAVSEWITPRLTDCYTHRHASHLYRLFYSRPVELETDPVLEAAYVEALLRRMEYRRNDATGAMAFGLVQLAHAAISLRRPALFDEILGWLTTGYWSSAMTTTHDRGAIFNVDICGGLPSVMARAIVDRCGDRLDLLPALPGPWARGTLTGVCCAGGLVLDVSWAKEGLGEVHVTATRDTVLRLRYREDEFTRELRAGERVTIDGHLKQIL